MKSAGEILKNKTPAELAREAWSKDSLITPEQERITKDIGRGILVPNAFQVPNEIIDYGWLGVLNGAELKVLLFIIRKTFGFNKISGDRIPLSQIMDATKLAKSTILEATAALEKDKLIRVIRGKTDDGTRKINYYQLIVRNDYNRN
jgi:DNA-binding MarR family transcriptional regulator